MTRRFLATVCVVSVAGMLSVIPASAQTPVRPGQSNRPEAPKGTGVVRGRITAGDTGKPLRRAQLSLFGLSPIDRYTTSTNARGEYEFKDIPEGRFTLSVSRGGYLRLQYGERRPGEGGKPIQLAEGQRLERVDLALPRAAIISGTLVDETGEPIAGVSVYAMRQAYYLGRRRLVPMGPGSRTDDTGQYRLLGLEPGDYFVMATPRETWTVKGPPAQTFGYAVTYFPGSANPSGAQRIQVDSGQEVPNTDFALVASRTATLSGTATRGDGAPAAGGSVSLSQNTLGPMGGMSSSVASARVGADGSWTLPKIAPGEYQLSLSVDDRDRGRELSTMTVFVQGADMSGITLVADPGSDVSGEVTTAAGGPLPAGTGGRIRVVVDPIGPDRQGTGIIAGSDIGLVNTEGRFTFKAQSGPSIVRVTGLPPRWGVESIEIGGRDYTGGAIEVPAGKPLDGVRIVVTDRFPTITGTLTDDKGTTAEGTVLLFSADESKWLGVTDSVRSTRADQYGLYRFDMVRPGEYLAVALEYVPTWQVADPEFLAEIAPRASKVTVRESQPEQLNLRLRAR